MSIMSQFTALAMNAYDTCSIKQDVYKDLVGNINHETSLAYGKKVSEEVANFVSSPPISDKMGEANKSFDYIIQNCSVPEKALKMIADYNQNIYDSLDLYKNTVPHTIPELGDGMSGMVLTAGILGAVAGVGYLARKYNERKAKSDDR